ncbi:MAG: hypothetical protein ACOCP8_05870 [archaeon]
MPFTCKLTNKNYGHYLYELYNDTRIAINHLNFYEAKQNLQLMKDMIEICKKESIDIKQSEIYHILKRYIKNIEGRLNKEINRGD